MFLIWNQSCLDLNTLTWTNRRLAYWENSRVVKLWTVLPTDNCWSETHANCDALLNETPIHFFKEMKWLISNLRTGEIFVKVVLLLLCPWAYFKTEGGKAFTTARRLFWAVLLVTVFFFMAKALTTARELSLYVAIYLVTVLFSSILIEYLRSSIANRRKYHDSHWGSFPNVSPIVLHTWWQGLDVERSTMVQLEEDINWVYISLKC